jgi:hypothetical protein
MTDPMSADDTERVARADQEEHSGPEQRGVDHHHHAGAPRPAEQYEWRV